MTFPRFQNKLRPRSLFDPKSNHSYPNGQNWQHSKGENEIEWQYLVQWAHALKTYPRHV